MENNNRTYCSFRDPDKRKDLTFKAFEMKNGQKTYKLNSVGSAPLVADSFEYRYHTDADILDYIMDPIKEADKYNSEDAQAYMSENNVDLLFDGNDKTKNFNVRADFIWNKYKNWEKACQWVWSTCTDYVISQGEYAPIEIGAVRWTPAPNAFYVLDENNEYVPDTSTEWDADTIYYSRSYNNETKTYVYTNAHAVVGMPIFSEVKNDLYIIVNDAYVSCANEPEFNDSIIYYQLNNYSDEELASKHVDRLVRQCSADDVFDSNEVYYTYDGTQPNGYATTKVTGLTEEQFNANPTQYWVGITVTYKGKEYKYDTKEYRGDKFINELAKHFDLEYMATYFVMTEVFECYDSRGKNCMMASWGPQEAGGDYIWYPIFYDIDTQLGVNNTGIPSFEYNVDATEDGNYSTSDSVLWNNFYKYFKSSAIISKYKHLKGVTSGVQWTALKNPPLQSVDYIEGWYNTNPKICNQIVMRGKRPIVAQNLDEYYKYITITNGSNTQALENGLIGHLSSDDQGNFAVDEGTYFYMLQGNRSLARRQFLTNRIEYIDSWLNQGNYQRGGFNRIRGRVAANNALKTSDQWVAASEADYFDQNGNKKYLFDAEYWLTLTPTHSSYVTLGDDNEAYPSQKYDGIHPLKFEVSAIKSGVLTSQNYPEQLLYIYGVNHMNDLGDMSKLYWQEFSIEGSAAKLTSLKFGYDGQMDDPDNPGSKLDYHNNNVNNPSFGASKDSITGGLPLLKYMNISNVQLSQGSAVLDLTSCEKLENFRATGSNYSEIKFAEGVALNTLYLPAGITSLQLTEARLLKNLITEYHYPVLNLEGELEAEPGLYIQGLFENNTPPALSTLNILGSGMGYDSYKLLKRYYDVRKNQGNSSNIQMTNVQWSPYVKVNGDEEYDNTAIYYIDDGHYGLTLFDHNTDYHVDKWPVQVANGEIYRLNSNETANNINQIDDSAIEMLYAFANSESQLFRTDETNSVPNITGIIYIKNANIVDEVAIRNELQPKFPHLTFFFENVNKAYTAKFLLMDADEGENGTYTLIGSQTIESGWFSDPIVAYGDISRQKPNHDFKGWAASNNLTAPLLVSLDGTTSWQAQTLDPNKFTYYFYAICPIHSWTIKFFSDGQLFSTITVPHGEPIKAPSVYPERDETALPADQTYQLIGFNRDQNGIDTVPVDLNTFNAIQDETFYALWNPETVSVYDNIHPEYFEVVSRNATAGIGGDYSYSGMEIRLKVPVKGKLTVPAQINGENVVIFSSMNSPIPMPNAVDSNLQNVTHVFFEKIKVYQNEEIVREYTPVKVINRYTFYRCTNLQYFEFTAPGLEYLDDSAFFRTDNLLLSTNIEGTIKYIGNGTFNRCFNQGSGTLILGNSIEYISAQAFVNIQNGHYVLSLGTEDAKFSSLTIGEGSAPFSTSNTINSIDSVYCYVNIPNREGTYFESPAILSEKLFGQDLTGSKTIQIIG